MSAFEVCVRHVATVIEDQRREEGKADPRETRFPDPWSSSDPDPAGPSEDGAAWSYLEGGDAPPVEHYEPAAVLAAQ